MFVLPPQNFRTVIAGGWAAGQPGYEVSILTIKLLDIRLAAHVQPGVKACGWRKLIVNRAHACHLAVEGYCSDIPGIDTALDQAAFHRPRRGMIKIIILLFDRARVGII